MFQPICLICEDEPLVALDLEACLAASGVGMVGPFTTSNEALRWSEAGETPYVALLNLKLNDGLCTPLLRALQAGECQS